MPDPILSKEQREELLRVYLSRGFQFASPLAIQFGVSPKVMSKYARRAGHKGKRGREPKVKAAPVRAAPLREPRIVRRKRRDVENKLWQRAIARGEVRI